MRRFIEDDEYVIEIRPDLEFSTLLKDCPISCGIREIDEVGGFIEELHREGLSCERIAKELEIMANRAKDQSLEKCAFVMISLASPSKTGKKVLFYLRKKGYTITALRRNPNSGNKINVIIM